MLFGRAAARGHTAGMLGTRERLFLRLDEDALHGPESDTPSGTLWSFAVPPPLAPYVSQVLLCRERLLHALPISREGGPIALQGLPIRRDTGHRVLARHQQGLFPEL